MIEPPTFPETDTRIVVLNCRRGTAPVVAICDVLVGDIKIYGVTIRRGLGRIYVNFPQRYKDGVWEPIVEIRSHDLLEAIRYAILMAAWDVRQN
ncbi:MAG TPA: hypothetical protein PKE45_07110 [Caldilineaceae bacterium]|nr:hypothetical protein [Caldilineaceae bacterium]